jgi:FixJ family two-component response regulator
LTGAADIASTISAINQGNIFRFPTKPCSTATFIGVLETSVEQYRPWKTGDGH